MIQTIDYADFVLQISGQQALNEAWIWLIDEFLCLKIEVLTQKKQDFERQYGIDFETFEKEVLDQPEHDWEMEKIVIEWDKTLTLLTDYQQLYEQWTQRNSKPN